MTKFKCNFPWINDFQWKSSQLQSCITFQDLQLLFCLFLNLRLFENFKFQMWEIKRNFHWIHDFKSKSCQLQSCITFWDLELLFRSFLHLRLFPITTHSFVSIEHMNSFGIKSIKYCQTNISASNDFKTWLLALLVQSLWTHGSLF